jgi:hypothetical protein
LKLQLQMYLQRSYRINISFQISFLLLHSFDPYYIPYTLKNTKIQFNYNHCIPVFIPSMINHVIL